MGRGVACEAAVVCICTRRPLMASVLSIPVAAATTVPPISGWVGFGRSVRGELQAYGTLSLKCCDA